ncbi:MAG TPA: LUD domain-containing protein, partial [Candidatus Norongarragalinales archaeon]|nr:LUD domain-containing protein [Candidatus Norongarragalinales archaeon]
MGSAELADSGSVEKTIAALKQNGFDAFLVENAAEAKQKIIELIPQGAEVMTMTSATLDAEGIAKEINESGKFESVRKKLNSMDRKTQGPEMQKLGAAPDWVVGSVHAVTEDGKILVA